jgi:hypothetical protein
MLKNLECTGVLDEAVHVKDMHNVAFGHSAIHFQPDGFDAVPLHGLGTSEISEKHWAQDVQHWEFASFSCNANKNTPTKALRPNCERKSNQKVLFHG